MIYRIKNWIENFENNRTKEMKDMRWVPVPNKHDGEGFRRIMAEKDGIIIYGCWNLILQTASKSHPRGTLLRDDGTPITAAIISLKTGWGSVKDFQRTLDFCSSPEVGWIEILTQEGEAIPHPPAEIPHPPARNGRNGMEEKGKDICDSWNSIAKQYGLPEIQKLTDKRLSKLEKRLEAFPDFWDVIKREIPVLGAFAKGDNNTGWKLDFDFCVESETNFAKLAEGKYRDNKPEGSKPQRQGMSSKARYDMAYNACTLALDNADDTGHCLSILRDKWGKTPIDGRDPVQDAYTQHKKGKQ